MKTVRNLWIAVAILSFTTAGMTGVALWNVLQKYAYRSEMMDVNDRYLRELEAHSKTLQEFDTANRSVIPQLEELLEYKTGKRR